MSRGLLALGFVALAGAAATADTLYLTDGRILRGRVERLEKDSRLKLVLPHGAVTFSASEVLRYEGGPAARAAYERRKADAAAAGEPDHAALGRFCEAEGLTEEARAEYRLALAADPAAAEPLARLSALTVADLALELSSAAEADRPEILAAIRAHGDRAAEGLRRAFDLRMTLAREHLAGGAAASLPDRVRKLFLEKKQALLAAVANPGYVEGGAEEARRVARLGFEVRALARRSDLSAALAADPVLERHLAALHVLASGIGEAAGAAGHPKSQIERLLDPLRESLASTNRLGESGSPAASNAAVGRDNDADLAKLIPHERAGIEAVNGYRELLGLPILRVELRLVEASRGHVKAMLERRFFEHESPVPGHRTPWDRAVKAGYPALTIGENLAQQIGAPLDAEGALRAWISSPAHHANMLKRKYVHIGIGMDRDTWVLLLGIPRAGKG
ncbi:MAG: CAP domain-containing protein [Planctomycetales bacterium]|nr:CAP domain-containing protein [Planctomycetales bacterium]